MSSLHRISYFLVLPLKALLTVILYQPFVLALPQGGQVTHGAATIQQVGDTKLNINQSTDRAVINWNSFSIAPQEWVNFQQPSRTSATLNRVTGNTPSSIAGRLTANGQVFLVNPNGIAFLPTAQVDVAGLVASTLNIKDSDFMQGILRFEQVPGKPPASVVNEGLITVQDAGFAALVAPAVRNSGVISARLGKVVLASGTTVSLDFYGDGLLSVTVDPKLAGEITDIYGNKLTSLIDNQGNILAPGGTVILTAQAAGQVVNNVINTGGIIEAKYAENRNGVIVLSGGSKGTVAVNGTLDVSGEKGGKVQITGENVGLFGTAKIDASGDKAGGLILVGGDYLGGRADKQRIDPALNAQNTYVSHQSILSADAKVSGNGGEVIVWADNFTRFDGKITATGDNGGFVETSGRNILEIGDTAQVDTTGKIGNTGTWLLDPLNLTISGTGTNNNVTGASPFTPTGTGSILRDTTINTALATNNVVVKTVGTTGTERGDIIFANNANVNWTTNKTFTVQAAGQIVMNSGTKITSTNTGSFNAVILEANKAGTTTGNFHGIELQDNAKITTQGGSIQLTGVGGTTAGNAGVLISGANTSITTQNNGTITITGTGKGTAGHGIVQKDGAQVTTANGIITYKGTGTGIKEGIRTESSSSLNIIGGNSNKSVVLTSLANGITLNDVKIQTKENIILTSPGNVTQNNTGALLATNAGKGLQLNGAGNYTLTNPNNDIATFAAKNTGNISYRDANGFVVGTVGTVNGINTATTKNVSLEAGG
ncbi:MAG: filamentous hemagglutinin N-terminal domain-containing protein, partial [Gloeomargarita sp. HHBFW_bins_162]